MLSSAAPHPVLANVTSRPCNLMISNRPRRPAPWHPRVLPCRSLGLRQWSPHHGPCSHHAFHLCLLCPPSIPVSYPAFFPYPPASLAAFRPPLPVAPPAPHAQPLPGSAAVLNPPAGLVTPVRALISENTNLVAEYRRVSLDPARAAAGSLATLPSADIIPFSRSAGV